MAQILDGKQTAQKIKQELKAKVDEFVLQNGYAPCLATLRVEGDPASEIYVRNKIRTCHELGMTSLNEVFKASIDFSELKNKILELNQNKSVHGILLQLPLPAAFDSLKTISLIDPKKDVDGFHPLNVGALWTGQDGFVPCTPMGVMRLLSEYNLSVLGKNIVVVGQSNIVGKPMAALLLKAGATVTVAHSKTKDLPKVISEAEVLVTAIGKPCFIKADWILNGAIVIDVGINRLPNQKLVGDVDFELAKSKVSHITPVPGGVGPMTIMMLMENTLKAAIAQRNLK